MRFVLLFLTAAALAPAQLTPFAGRWDFNDVSAPYGAGAAWLEVANGKITLQETTGNMFEVTKYRVDGGKLLLDIPKLSFKHPAMTWTLAPRGNELHGTQLIEGKQSTLHGVRAAEVHGTEPREWTAPQPLFNGKDLTGWAPFGGEGSSHWAVKDGLLVNEDHGANLKTTRTFRDFKVHFEANCPEGANSGFFLRGRYEVQLDYEAPGAEPVERRMGSIYGRIAPNPALPRTPGQWETFDVTLVGRTVTVIHNGVTIIDHKEIDGLTGGALDANESEPGPFYIQGDHTGGLKFRNIAVAVPKR
jgi:hypothetical protein